MQTNPLNPENTCAHLVKEEAQLPTVEEMFAMQLQLQKFLAAKGKSINYETATFKERVECISAQWRNMTLEFAELLERLPFKEWKTYTPEQLAGLSEEDQIEVDMEFIDMWHFMMNIGLLIGMNGEKFRKYYYLKNKENFDRQNRGY